MKFFKRIVASALALIMLFGFSSIYAQAAPATMTKFEIIKKPDKLVFYKNSDWCNGVWYPTYEGNDTTWEWQTGTKISFLHCPGGAPFAERGMLEMPGLQIKITYSNGSTKTITYQEFSAPSGAYYANILFAPKNGEEFKLGKNTIEVYVNENYRFYDTFDIEIVDKADPKKPMGDIDNNHILNSTDALLVLQYSVHLINFAPFEKAYADTDGNGRINSSDALTILRNVVNK